MFNKHDIHQLVQPWVNGFGVAVDENILAHTYVVHCHFEFNIGRRDIESMTVQTQEKIVSYLSEKMRKTAVFEQMLAQKEEEINKLEEEVDELTKYKHWYQLQNMKEAESGVQTPTDESTTPAKS